MWGAMAVNASNTQEAIAKLRAAAGRSSSWSFDMMLVDAGSIPTTLLALHRSVMRETTLEDLQIAYLRGDEDLPPEITENERVRIFTRDMGDVELRTQLSRQFESDGSAAAKGASGPTVNVTSLPSPDLTARQPALSPDQPLRGHVLLVEDNPVNRQVAQRLLALAGLTLDSAENGRDALEKLQAGAYDAVLMDCQMPVMDGYTATRQRRVQEADQRLDHVPIIAMTANAMVGDREKCLSVGMDDYLSKPLNRALLEETLRRWLPAVPISERMAASRRHVPAPETSRAPVYAAPARFAAREPVEIRHHEPEFEIAPVAIARSLPVKADASAGPVLDREIVDDLREIMGDEFVSLVRVFLEDAPRALGKLEMAAARNDLEALVGPAHSLKSTSANLGALALSDLARTIEHGARQKSLGDPAVIVGQMSREFHRVETALRGFLG
jgi:CheY-like chemotaxis protein/HPt (histidine-containing phosphotransfer) domain-containing protein